MYESLKTICTLANKIHANVTVVIAAEGLKGNIVELMVTKDPQQGVKLEIRLLLMGEPGSGKSTLLGVIKSG
jgi:GTPase